MDFNPFAIYRAALAAVPSIKYALAVAGVVAAAMIAYNLSSEDPKRAILAFIFVLAGMYLLLIFASIGKVGDIIRGPIITVVWALSILFIISLILTLTAHATGVPCGWANLVGAACADFRTTSAEGHRKLPSNPITATNSTPATQKTESTPAIQKTESTQPFRIQEVFRITDGSDDCSINQTRTLEYCLASGAQILDWSGPNIESANCGSNISNIRRIASKENCIAVDVSVRGCGYDNIFGMKNCKGRGWIGGSILINGQRPQE